MTRVLWVIMLLAAFLVGCQGLPSQGPPPTFAVEKKEVVATVSITQQFTHPETRESLSERPLTKDVWMASVVEDHAELKIRDIDVEFQLLCPLACRLEYYDKGQLMNQRFVTLGSPVAFRIVVTTDTDYEVVYGVDDHGFYIHVP